MWSFLEQHMRQKARDIAHYSKIIRIAYPLYRLPTEQTFLCFTLTFPDRPIRWHLCNKCIHTTSRAEQIGADIPGDDADVVEALCHLQVNFRLFPHLTSYTCQR